MINPHNVSSHTNGTGTFYIKWKVSTLTIPFRHITACLSGAARHNAIRVSAVENWSTALRGPVRRERGGCFCSLFSSFSIEYVRLLSAVENLGSPRY